MNRTLLVFTLLAATAASADAGTLFVQSARVERSDGGVTNPSHFRRGSRRRVAIWRIK